MRAILLAAGRGLRLQQSDSDHQPKCLLRFGGMTLLERHLRLLREVGVTDVALGLGFQRELVEAELDRLGWRPRPVSVVNHQFELGSMLTVHTMAAQLTDGADILLMDADVLYDVRIARALVAGADPVNRVLIDRDFEPGDEPVKVCVKRGVPVELRKKPEPGLDFDFMGESVGFFRLNAAGARRLADIVAGYAERGEGHLPHEEALRDLVRERRVPVEVADISGAPWIETDFPADVARAAQEILPQLHRLEGG